MARENKLYSKTRVTSIAQDDLLTIGQLQSDGTYKVKTITRNNAMASFVGSYTYDELTAIVTASELIVGAPYLITNATSANINLIVSAVAVNKIGCDAKSPDFQNDEIKYNFTTNAITYRKDAIRNISFYADWRNSNSITVSASALNINCGKGTTGTFIGETIGITAGEFCGLVFTDVCTNVSCGNSCGIVGAFNNVTFGNSVVLEGSVDISVDGAEFKNGFYAAIEDGQTLANPDTYFKTYELNSDGDAKVYYISGNSFLFANAIQG